MQVMELQKNFAPARKTTGAGGYDLRNAGPDIEIQEGQGVKIPTGFCVALPPRHVGVIKLRSSLCCDFANPEIFVESALGPLAGVIDEDYRGEVVVAIYRNLTKRRLANAIWEMIAHGHWAIRAPLTVIKHGDRIAQMLVLPCYQGSVELVDKLPDSERGIGGFGSTGKG
jgi:dUTP pyrophosphatase